MSGMTYELGSAHGRMCPVRMAKVVLARTRRQKFGVEQSGKYGQFDVLNQTNVTPLIRIKHRVENWVSHDQEGDLFQETLVDQPTS